MQLLLAKRFVRAATLPFHKQREIIWSALKLFSIDRKLRRSGVLQVQHDLAGSLDLSPLLFVNQTPKDIAQTIRRGARISIGRRNSCLRRALLLSWIFEQRGIPSQLKVGINSSDGNLNGHAWVEVDGRPVAEHRDVCREYEVIEFAPEMSSRQKTVSPVPSRLNLE